MKKLQDVKCFLLDMDGTFYLGDKIFDTSLAFIDKLGETGRDYMFLTNNSSHNVPFYVERLKKMGLEIDGSKIMTSGVATADYLKKHGYAGKRAFLLGNSFLQEELTTNGVLISDDDPEYVILGFDTTLDYQKMTRVCTLARQGLPMIATHPDFNCPTPTGDIPDIGAIMAFINASTGRTADVVVGKPNRYIFDAVMSAHHLKKEDLAMVGDRLYTDIKSGKQNGITSILVLTGETDQAMLENSEIKPDFVFDNLKKIGEAL
jgi:HAD superfamily hydrolase (TIGR01457 family)